MSYLSFHSHGALCSSGKTSGHDCVENHFSLAVTKVLTVSKALGLQQEEPLLLFAPFGSLALEEVSRCSQAKVS